MRYIYAFGLSLLLILGLTTTGFAHNGWTEINTPVIETGQNSYIKLLFGNHSDDHTSYRIDRNWGIEDSTVHVITPSGTKVNVTDQFFYMGETTEVDEERIGVNNYYLGSFVADEAGAYIVAAEGNFTYGDQEQPTLRSAKTFLGSSKVTTVKGARKIKGFNQQVTPDRAELIPLFNPSAITPGEKASAQLLLKGKSVPDVEVAVIRRSDSSDIRLKTDQDGKVTWTTGPADYYLVRAEVEADEKNQEYEATMTFTVQN